MGKVINLTLLDERVFQYWTEEGEKEFKRAVAREKRKRHLKGNCENESWYREIFERMMSPQYRTIYWDYVVLNRD